MSMGLLKHALKFLAQESRDRTPSRRQVNQWFKWLAPGLLIKRWLLISATGMVFAGLGFAI